MSGFSFPPPPPPPPKPVQAQQYTQQNRGRGRGRGDARGGSSQHGRNESGHRGNYGSNGFQRSNSGPYGNEGNGSFQSSPASAAQPGAAASQSQNIFSNSALPPGSYINPRFAGNQYVDNFANRNSASTSFGSQVKQQYNEGPYPSRSVAGHKRKLAALRETSRENKTGPPTAPAIPGFGAATLPAKPKIPTNEAEAKVNRHPNSRLVGRSLGLLPRLEDDPYSSGSDGDDQEVDEEAAYAELGDKLTFEHNGVLMSLKSMADLEAWKKERRRNYPTEQRKTEKYIERQRIGEERKRLLASAHVLRQPLQRTFVKSDRKTETGPRPTSFCTTYEQGDNLQDRIKAEHPDVGLGTGKGEMDERAKKLEMLRQKVAQSEDRNRKARAQQAVQDQDEPVPVIKAEVSDKIEDTVDMYDPATIKSDPDEVEIDTRVEPHDKIRIKPEPTDEDEVDIASQNHDSGAEEAVTSSSSPSDSSSDISSDSSADEEDDSDNEPPEELDSKPLITATPGRPMPVCRYFAARGSCRDGDACRYKHETRPVQASTGVQNSQTPQERQQKRQKGQELNRVSATKKGIFERLKEQEQGDEDRLALKVIKYLGGVGFFKEPVPVKEESVSIKEEPW